MIAIDDYENLDNITKLSYKYREPEKFKFSYPYEQIQKSLKN